jgi:hypothetical protein
MDLSTTKLPATQRIGASAYSAIHSWVYRHYGKANRCVDCGENGRLHYQWANISGEYKRDISDWRQLCVPCHIRADRFPEILDHIKRISQLEKPRAWRAVTQTDAYGDVVQKYKSIKEAAKATGISNTAINNNLMGRSKSAGGFRWI